MITLYIENVYDLLYMKTFTYIVMMNIMRSEIALNFNTIKYCKPYACVFQLLYTRYYYTKIYCNNVESKCLKFDSFRNLFN